MRRIVGFVLAAVALAACEPIPTSTQSPQEAASAPPLQTTDAAARTFLEVKNRLEPVAERECRIRTRNVDCDFRIVVDSRPGQPANAYQTLDDNNRPIIAFTTKLLNQARNMHEVAFVMGHEAAHHIEGHLKRQRQNAEAGALIFGGLATLAGADAGAVETALKQGAFVGSRTYSKEFELEADALGTIITAKAGYDPLVGAQFFNRIPDPGNRFLGTHPPNAQRLETVRKTAAGL